MRHIVSMLLQNESGALARIAGMFAARGFNIESLTVAPTHDPAISRLSLVAYGDDAAITQIVKQSRKFVDVIEVVDMSGREHIESELLVVKVRADADSAAAVASIARSHHGGLLDADGSVQVLQFAGSGAQMGVVLAELGAVSQVLEFARSGTAALDRGERTLGAGLCEEAV